MENKPFPSVWNTNVLNHLLSQQLHPQQPLQQVSVQSVKQTARSRTTVQTAIAYAASE